MNYEKKFNEIKFSFAEFLNVRMLSDDVVRQLADGEDYNYQFDFSKISAEFYEPLLRTLQHFAQKKIISIGFSCDSLAKAQSLMVSGQTMPIFVANSIALKRTHYISNIIQLLCHIFPRSTRIKEVTLSNMNIRKDYLAKLFKHLPKSKSLEKIVFNKIQIGDELLNGLLNVLDPNQIKEIQINYCGISSASTNSIINFIQKRTNNQSGLKSFVISKTEIPENEQMLISNALNATQATPSPSRIDKINIPSPKQSPITPISTGRSSLSGLSPAQKEQKMKIELAQIRAYEKENEELKKELAELRKSLNAIPYNDNVFIVGKGAEEFVQFISEIESKIKYLQNQKDLHGGFL